KPMLKAAAMAATGAFLVLSPPEQNASDTPWRNAGWEIQSVQPPHRRIERAAAVMRGDDGTQAAKINWFNTGCELQPVQPPHPAPERRAGAVMRGDDGIQFTKINCFNTGWEVQPVQPPHPRPERFGALAAGDSGAEAKCVFVSSTITWGFEQQFTLRRLYRPATGL